MTIPEPILQLAIQKTTANGREAPNAYRILSWLYSCALIEGGITSLHTHSDDFEEVCAYLLSHFSIKTIPTHETGAAYQFTPSSENKYTRHGRLPAPRLPQSQVKVYQQFVKGAFTHEPRS